MKILLLTENFISIKSATAKIVKKITDYDKNIEYTVICKGPKKSHYLCENTNVFQIPSYYYFGHKNLIVFLRKVCIKFFKFLFPESLYDTKRFYFLGKKLIKKNKFDKIVSISGWFSTHASASKLSKKYNIPVFLVYTDPFLGNILTAKFNESRLIKTEKKWLKIADKIFMPQNYIEKYKMFYEYDVLKKIENFELPCIIEPIMNDDLKLKENYLIYTGGLFNRLKDYKSFDLFFGNINTVVKCYGEKPKNNKFENLKFYKREGENKIQKLIQESRGIVVVDNFFGIQIPSKAIEAVSSNKKVLFFYYEKNTACYQFLKKFDHIFFIDFKEINNIAVIQDALSYLNKKLEIKRTIYSNDSQLKKIINSF